MMPINLTLSAFGPYPNQININFESFQEDGLFLITGPTGSGKTMIFDALIFALYGKTSGQMRQSDSLRCDHALNEIPTFVELTFSLHQQIYTIKRSPKYYLEGKKTPKQPTALLILPDGKMVEGVKEVTSKVISLLGIDEHQFKQIVMIAQGEFTQLIMASSDEREKTDILIGNITNAIVRNRLQIFRDKILELKCKYGTPDEVIFEFVRDDNSLFGAKKTQEYISNINKNQKENEEIAQQLKNANCFSSKNLEKLKLLQKQGGHCIYSGRPIAISNLEECEIDHIYPRSRGGNDALSNKVLCYAIENQNKKEQTPYEWLHNNEQLWNEFVKRVTNKQEALGKIKVKLLISKPEDSEKLINSYNGLAETAQIARVAQDITAFVFGWGLQLEGEKRRIFVNNGATTSAIRKTYRLNKLLGNDVKKNRQNDKHHALDAICISFSRGYKYNATTKRDEIEGLDIHDNEFRDLVKSSIDSLLPYPYSNDKPFKGNIKPLETIYGYRKLGEKTYITQRVDITSIEQKDKKIKSIIDEIIKNDLLAKLEDKMTSKEWANMLSKYVHPTKKTKVKKVLLVVSEGITNFDENGRARIGEFVDFGTKGTKHQFKHSKGHKGQILYYNEKNAIKVMPIYANQKLGEVKDKLEQMNCKLYKKGMMFYSGCLIKVDKEFEGTAYYTIADENGKEKQTPNKEILPAGIYKLRTLMSDGTVKLESSIGIEILTSAKKLAEADFKKLTK